MAAPKRPLEQARALLNWGIACERLHMVVTPLRNASTAGLLDLDQAIALAEDSGRTACAGSDWEDLLAPGSVQ